MLSFLGAIIIALVRRRLHFIPLSRLPAATSPDLGSTKGSGYSFVVRWSCRSYSSDPSICYDTDKSKPSGECTHAVRMGE